MDYFVFNLTIFKSVLTIISHLRPSKMFRTVQGYRHGGVYKGTEVKRIQSKMCLCRAIQYCQLQLKNT